MSHAQRVAIVGSGAISRAHAAALEEMPDLELVALVDTNPAALAAAEEELGTPGFESLDELLAAGHVDVACICTPPSTHRGIGESLLHAGVDVLCEKPLATTSVDARALSETASRLGRRFAVSDKFRHVPDLLEAADRLHSGVIGEAVACAVTFCAPVDVRDRWPSDPELSGGGVLMDNGPHAFDVLSHILATPIDRLHATFARPRLAPAVEDTALLTFRTQDGVAGLIELSWAYLSRDLDYLTVQGTTGTLRVGWTGGLLRRHGDREWSKFGCGYDKVDAFRGVWRVFRKSGDSSPRGPSAIEALELIERAYATAT